MFEPNHEQPRTRRKLEPLCSSQARCHVLRFIHVEGPMCRYCMTAEALVRAMELLRDPVEYAYRLARELGPFVALLVALASCSSSRGMQARDAGELDAGEQSAWLCYCGGTHAITCTHSEPICSATDPSERVAKSERTSCSCSARGQCVRDADCIDVR
jgi:hypothetical protein